MGVGVKLVGYLVEGTQVIRDPTNCPHCGRITSGKPAIHSFFGFRKMADGITRVQSWCRECRILQRNGGRANCLE